MKGVRDMAERIIVNINEDGETSVRDGKDAAAHLDGLRDRLIGTEDTPFIKEVKRKVDLYKPRKK
jgi:hypothetical protein